MTDNEIIKALKELSERGMTFCNVSMGEFARNILALINRKDAQILELQGNLKFVRGTVERLLETSDKQRAEIERLKEADSIYEETTGLKYVKADAYKKFAKLLKEKRGLYGEIWESDIDNIVKELVGEE
jgi:hypothetical protein